MPAPLVHLSLVDRLAQDGRGLPPELRRCLREDLEYARFGAVLPDLPFFAGLGPLRQLSSEAPAVPPFALLLHGAAPVRFGLKLAELVASGSFVGRCAGLAVVAGYFSHLVVDRMLHPVTELIAERVRRPGENPRAAHQRVEWVQAWYYQREAYGREIIGTDALEEKLKVLKRRGLPLAGVGRGLYELMRVACDEVLGAAPSKREFDGWARGLYIYARLLSTRAGRWWVAPPPSPSTYRHTFDGPAIHMLDEIERALKECRLVAARVYDFMGRGEFTARGIGRFFAGYPEGSAGTLAG